MVELATLTLKKLANDFEIIVVDDGSTDASREILRELASKNKKLRLIFHEKNRGYGGALISGFRACRNEWIFYTDGDFQYDVSEIEKLVAKVSSRVDIVQGYKIKRHDPWYRILIGDFYNFCVKLLFAIKIRDVDCDFRLIRKRVFEKVVLSHTSGVITVEMVKKFSDLDFKFSEVGVNHFWRSYGHSQIFNFGRIVKVLLELVVLWKELMLPKWRRIFLQKEEF